MKSKRLRLRLGEMGTLLLVPRALCVAASSSRLTDDDARVALEPLNRIHLGKVDQGPISVRRVVWRGRTLGRRTAHRPTHCPILILGQGSFQMPRVEEDEMFQAVRTSAACITVTNARQRNAMPAGAFLSHDRVQAHRVRVKFSGRNRMKTQIFSLSCALAILAAATLLAQKTASPTKVTGKATTTASGLQYWDIVVGTGATAVAGKPVKVRYTGWLTDGKKFDSSVDRGQPFGFTLGAGQVIKGWDEGVAGMKVVGKRQLRIPPELGYGSRGAGSVIPPNATLIFDVELLEVGK